MYRLFLRKFNSSVKLSYICSCSSYKYFFELFFKDYELKIIKNYYRAGNESFGCEQLTKNNNIIKSKLAFKI